MPYRYVNGNLMKNNVKNHYDEYFTKPDIAKKILNKTLSIISRYDNIKKFLWIEPSVGDGSFYKILPKNKIGIDIKKTKFKTKKIDFLKYKLPNKSIIVIGNPPFGHRGVLALEFIKHSKNADYVVFILPMFFMSKGKGSIRYRVKDLNLIYEEILPKNSFYLFNGKDKDVKCCFQIWSKKHKIKNNEFSWYAQKENNEPFNKYIEVKTVSLAKNRECGKEWIFNKKANWYLSSSFFSNIKIVNSFSEVKYKSGIAIIYKTSNKQIIKKLNTIFKNADWKKYSSVATNGCHHIGKSHIFELLKDKGALKWK